MAGIESSLDEPGTPHADSGKPVRGRGRPATGLAKSNALRKQAERERLKAAGIVTATFKLSTVTLKKLDALAKSQQRHKDDLVEQFLSQGLGACDE